MDCMYKNFSKMKDFFFQTAGIAAGSTAASIMATYGGAVGAGSVCAVLQSVGAAGLGATVCFLQEKNYQRDYLSFIIIYIKKWHALIFSYTFVIFNKQGVFVSSGVGAAVAGVGATVANLL